MPKILFVLAVLAFTVAVPVYAADNVSGTWVLTQMSPMGGEDIWDVVITQDGENLNVTTTLSDSEIQVTFSGAGTLKGNKIKFSLKGPDNQSEFIFEGKVTGKKIEGTREFRNDSGNKMTLRPPSSDNKEPTDDEIESFNTWNAVMK